MEVLVKVGLVLFWAMVLAFMAVALIAFARDVLS